MKDVMEYEGYFGVVHFSPEDQCLFGKIVGIDDLVTFEGEDVYGIRRAFEESVIDYLAVCNTADKKPLKSVKGSLNIRLTPELHLKALIKAQKEKKSLNKLIQEAVEKEVTGEEI